MSIGAVAARFTLIKRVTERLECYFFRPGGTYGIAIARIALFTGIYVTYTKLPFSAGRVEIWYAAVSQAAYRPKGIVQLFWSAPPPVSLVETLIVVAQISTIMAVLGFLTRPAMITSVLSVLFLHSLGYSFVFGWSHPHNVMFLVGLAFMFGRAGDHLSADAVIRRWRAAHGTLVPKGRTGEFDRLELVLGGFERPTIRLFFAPDPRMTPGPAELVEVQGHFELQRGEPEGGLIGRFVLQPGQPLPWRAATLIEVSEQGRAEAWRFIGPVALW